MTNFKIQNSLDFSFIGRGCYGRNKINHYSKEQLLHVLPQLNNFIDKKVKTQKGDKAAAFKIDLLKFPFTEIDGGTYRSFLKFEYKRLVLFNDVTVKDSDYDGVGYGVTYYKQEIELGVVTDDGFLKSLFDFDEIVTRHGLDIVYDPAVIEETQKQIEVLEDKIRELKRNLF